MTVYRLRVVIAGISPLVWRRLEVPVGTMVAGLQAIVQTVFQLEWRAPAPVRHRRHRVRHLLPRRAGLP